MNPSKLSPFLRDAASRALATLPWASLEVSEIHRTSNEIRRMVESVGAEGASDVELDFIRDTFAREVAMHEACGNQLKADMLQTFLEHLLDEAYGLWQ